MTVSNEEKEFERYQIDLQRDKIEQRILMEGEYKFIFGIKLRKMIPFNFLL